MIQKHHLNAIEVILEMEQYISDPKIISNASEIGKRCVSGDSIPQYMLTRLEEHITLFVKAWENDSETLQLLQKKCMPHTLSAKEQVWGKMQSQRDLLKYVKE